MVRGDYNMYIRQTPMLSFVVCPPHVFIVGMESLKIMQNCGGLLSACC